MRMLTDSVSDTPMKNLAKRQIMSKYPSRPSRNVSFYATEVRLAQVFQDWEKNWKEKI